MGFTQGTAVHGALKHSQYIIRTFPAATTDLYTGIANAHDNDLTTFAEYNRAGGDTNEWVVTLMYDLGSIQKIEAYVQAVSVAANGTAGGSGTGMRIGISIDNTNWFYCKETNGTSAATYRLNQVIMGLARYIRIECYYYSTGGGTSQINSKLYELGLRY